MSQALLIFYLGVLIERQNLVEKLPSVTFFRVGSLAVLTVLVIPVKNVAFTLMLFFCFMAIVLHSLCKWGFSLRVRLGVVAVCDGIFNLAMAEATRWAGSAGDIAVARFNLGLFAGLGGIFMPVAELLALRMQIPKLCKWTCIGYGGFAIHGALLLLQAIGTEMNFLLNGGGYYFEGPTCVKSDVDSPLTLALSILTSFSAAQRYEGNVGRAPCPDILASVAEGDAAVPFIKVQICSETPLATLIFFVILGAFLAGLLIVCVKTLHVPPRREHEGLPEPFTDAKRRRALLTGAFVTIGMVLLFVFGFVGLECPWEAAPRVPGLEADRLNITDVRNSTTITATTTTVRTVTSTTGSATSTSRTSTTALTSTSSTSMTSTSRTLTTSSVTDTFTSSTTGSTTTGTRTSSSTVTHTMSSISTTSTTTGHNISVVTNDTDVEVTTTLLSNLFANFTPEELAAAEAVPYTRHGEWTGRCIFPTGEEPTWEYFSLQPDRCELLCSLRANCVAFSHDRSEENCYLTDQMGLTGHGNGAGLWKCSTKQEAQTAWECEDTDIVVVDGRIIVNGPEVRCGCSGAFQRGLWGPVSATAEQFASVWCALGMAAPLLCGLAAFMLHSFACSMAVEHWTASDHKVSMRSLVARQVRPIEDEEGEVQHNHSIVAWREAPRDENPKPVTQFGTNRMFSV